MFNRDRNRDRPLSPNGTERVISVGDVMMVAYYKLRGHTVIPWISDDDPRDPHRVEFDVIGEEGSIEKSMEAYYNNEPVGINDYIRCVKDAKTTIWNMKKIIKGEGKP